MDLCPYKNIKLWRYGKHASPTDEIVVFLRREKQG